MARTPSEPASRPDAAQPPQRSTRQPAEGADPGQGFDQPEADGGETPPPERSPRAPAEGGREDDRG